MTIISSVTEPQRKDIEKSFGHYGDAALVAIQEVLPGTSLAVCQVNGTMVTPFLLMTDETVNYNEDGTVTLKKASRSRRGCRFLRNQKYIHI